MTDRKFLSFAFRLACSFGLLGILLYAMDSDVLLQAVERLQYRWLVAAAAVLVVLRLLLAARWHRILVQLGLPAGLGEVVRVSLVAGAFGLLLPASLGTDMLRGYRLAGKYGNAAAVATGILVDRVVGVYSMLLVAGVGAVASWWSTGQSEVLVILAIMQVLFLGGWIGAILIRRRIVGFIGKASSPSKWGKYWQLIRTSLLQLTDVGLLKRVLPASLAISIVIQLFRCVMILCLYRAFFYDVGFVDCLIYVPLVFLVMFVPVSIAGLGVREGALAVFFAPLGIPAGVSLGVGLTSHGLQALFAIAVVVVWLLATGAAYLQRRPAEPG